MELFILHSGDQAAKVEKNELGMVRQDSLWVSTPPREVNGFRKRAKKNRGQERRAERAYSSLTRKRSTKKKNPE